MYRFDPTELTKFAGLTLLARRVVEGFLTGIHRSPFKGFSIEFAEHRQYYPGDEIRHIDWRAFGKTDRYYIKEYEEETNLRLYLAVDASGSMRFRGTKAKVSKFEYAQRVAASLAYLMLHQLDAVGMIVHDTEVRSLIPPKTSPKHLLNLLTTLEKATPGGETSLAPIWDQLANHHLKRRGMVIILSDFFDAIDPVIKALQHLKFRHHEVILMQILAPEEIDFPYDRATEFRSLERAGVQVRVDPRRLRQEYRANFEAFCADLKTQAGKLHFDYHRLRTDEPIEKALGIYLSRRQK